MGNSPATDERRVSRPELTVDRRCDNRRSERDAVHLAGQERHSYEPIDAVYRRSLETDRPIYRYMGEMLETTCTVGDAIPDSGLFSESSGVIIRCSELGTRPLQFTTYVEDVPRDERADRGRVYDLGLVSLYV